MNGKILVPVDFSPHTEFSCRYALATAILLQKEIVLFHSFFDQIYFSDGGFVTGFESGIMFTDEIILDFYKQKENKLIQISEDLSKQLSELGQEGLNVKYELESGDPEVQILNAITRIRPDLIIMGSSGMGKKGLFAGSVARRIMDHTDVPVIAVPEKDVAAKFENVAYMTNFESSDPEALIRMDALLVPLNIHYHCIHICLTADTQEAKKSMELLSSRNLSTRPGSTFSYEVIYNPDNGSAFEEFIESRQIDLIAFIPHKRHIFKHLLKHNITKNDLFLTRVPILAIPAES